MKYKKRLFITVCYFRSPSQNFIEPMAGTSTNNILDEEKDLAQVQDNKIEAVKDFLQAGHFFKL